MKTEIYLEMLGFFFVIDYCVLQCDAMSVLVESSASIFRAEEHIERNTVLSGNILRTIKIISWGDFCLLLQGPTLKVGSAFDSKILGFDY